MIFCWVGEEVDDLHYLAFALVQACHVFEFCLYVLYHLEVFCLVELATELLADVLGL